MPSSSFSSGMVFGCMLKQGYSLCGDTRYPVLQTVSKAVPAALIPLIPNSGPLCAFIKTQCKLVAL